MAHAEIQDAVARAQVRADTVGRLGGGVWALTIFARRRDAAQARREFSHALLLGLDFTIGADMLKLARVPDLSAAALAAGVTAVRIALTLTLLREERLAMAPHPPST